MLEQLQALLRSYLDDDSVMIDESTALNAQLGLDSYDLASLLGMVEERFNVVIPDRTAMEMQTVGDIAAYLTANI